MTNDDTNCTAIDVVGKRMVSAKPATRDLRLEILQLRSQLKECEVEAARHLVMLREGDHRIKNSLQLVASMMRLQGKRETSRPVRAALDAAAGRVSSVAAIHDALQGARGADRVDLGVVLRKMCASLQAMAGDSGYFDVVVNAETLEIPIALAQPIVLAVNELVVNALRHAFPNRESGSVRVDLARTKSGITVRVSDDGVGLPLNHAASRGYGMSLVSMMVRQIGGKLQTQSGSGSHFTIHAPVPA